MLNNNNNYIFHDFFILKSSLLPLHSHEITSLTSLSLSITLCCASIKLSNSSIHSVTSIIIIPFKPAAASKALNNCPQFICQDQSEAAALLRFNPVPHRCVAWIDNAAVNSISWFVQPKEQIGCHLWRGKVQKTGESRGSCKNYKWNISYSIWYIELYSDFNCKFNYRFAKLVAPCHSAYIFCSHISESLMILA